MQHNVTEVNHHKYDAFGKLNVPSNCTFRRFEHASGMLNTNCYLKRLSTENVKHDKKDYAKLTRIFPVFYQ